METNHSYNHEKNPMRLYCLVHSGTPDTYMVPGSCRTQEILAFYMSQVLGFMYLFVASENSLFLVKKKSHHHPGSDV